MQVRDSILMYIPMFSWLKITMKKKIFSKCMSEQGFEPMHIEFDGLLTQHFTTELQVIIESGTLYLSQTLNMQHYRHTCRLLRKIRKTICLTICYFHEHSDFVSNLKKSAEQL